MLIVRNSIFVGLPSVLCCQAGLGLLQEDSQALFLQNHFYAWFLKKRTSSS